MIATRDAVTLGLEQACLDGVIGIGRGASPAVLHSRYCKEKISLDPNEEGIWIIPPFAPQPEVPPPGKAGSKEGGPEGVSGERPHPPVVDGGRPGGRAEKHLIHRFTVRGSVPLENYSELFRCFVSPAAKMKLKRLSLRVQFEMETHADSLIDPNDPGIKAMREAARQLGLEFDIEEK